jgi:spermidine synthase
MSRLAWLLSFGTGFLSLSEEILWVRLVGFIYQGVPQAFSGVLGVYLLGIALGAAWGKRLCERHPNALLLVSAAALGISGAIDFSLPTLLNALGDADPLWRAVGIVLALTASSASKAVLFPIAHHLGTRIDGQRLGRSLSRVYFLNIAGSTLGPLVTGFVLLDHLSIDDGYRWIGAACWVMAAACLLPRRAAAGAFLLATAATTAGTLSPGRHDILRAHALPGGGTAVKAIISNRHGVLHMVEGGRGGDVVYGGNVYDGRTNVDLKTNSNKIDRAYLLAALHPRPTRVLVIGMSTGAWLRVLAEAPGVATLDVVEINPGYLELISAYPSLAPMLNDPRIRIHIDDGRRWLKRHPDERFDLVVMNTTFHWRAQAANLLSHQFLELVRRHLAPGGIMAFNATGSPDALYTAASVFSHAYRWSNFVYAADHDFRPRVAAPDAPSRVLLTQSAVSHAAQVPAGSDATSVHKLLAQPFVTLTDVQRDAGRSLEVIDDDALQTEFKYGKALSP